MDTPTKDPLAAADDRDPGPLPPATAANKTIDEQIVDLHKMVAALLAVQQGNMQLMAGMQAAAMAKPTDEQLQAVASADPMPAAKPMPRVKVILEDNDNIPPGGQFIQVDGVSYLLQPNMEANVPVNVLDVLDHAVMSVPVTDENRNITGYRDRLRFPYRVVRDRERDIADRERDLAAQEA
jgi:hypothetical protein